MAFVADSDNNINKHGRLGDCDDSEPRKRVRTDSEPTYMTFPGGLVVVRDTVNTDEQNSQLLEIQRLIRAKDAQAKQAIAAFAGNINVGTGAFVQRTLFATSLIAWNYKALRALARRADFNPNACGLLATGDVLPALAHVRAERVTNNSAFGVAGLKRLFPQLSLNAEFTGVTRMHKDTTAVKRKQKDAETKSEADKKITEWWELNDAHVPARGVRQCQSLLCWLLEDREHAVAQFCLQHGVDQDAMCSAPPHHTARQLGVYLGSGGVIRHPDTNPATTLRGAFVNFYNLLRLPAHASVEQRHTADGPRAKLLHVAPCAELTPPEDVAAVRSKPRPQCTKVYRDVKDMLDHMEAGTVQVSELSDADKARWYAWTSSKAYAEMQAIKAPVEVVCIDCEDDAAPKPKSKPGSSRPSAVKARETIKTTVGELARREFAVHAAATADYVQRVNTSTDTVRELRADVFAMELTTFAPFYAQLVKTKDLETAEEHWRAHAARVADIDVASDKAGVHATEYARSLQPLPPYADEWAVMIASFL